MQEAIDLEKRYDGVHVKQKGNMYYEFLKRLKYSKEIIAGLLEKHPVRMEVEEQVRAEPKAKRLKVVKLIPIEEKKKEEKRAPETQIQPKFQPAPMV